MHFSPCLRLTSFAVLSLFALNCNATDADCLVDGADSALGLLERYTLMFEQIQSQTLPSDTKVNATLKPVYNAITSCADLHASSKDPVRFTI
jgi:hypothetical protein